MPLASPVPRAQVPATDRPERSPPARCSATQAGTASGASTCAVDVETLLGLGRGRLDGGEEAVAQDAELEAVEDRVDLLAAPTGCAGGPRPRRRPGCP